MADHNRWVKFYPRDWIADTRTLTTEEQGAYFLLWIESVLRDGRLPVETETLRELAGIKDAGRWNRVWGKIAHYFALADGGTALVQRRVLKELELAKDRIENARRGGQKSGERRRKNEPELNSSSTGVELQFNSSAAHHSWFGEVDGNDQGQEQKAGADHSQTAPPAPAPMRSTGDAKPWNEHVWRERFARAWCEKYGRPGYGDAGDTKACVSLGYVLTALPESERLDAQRRAPEMFAEFLAQADPRVVDRRHPFVFFVQEFGGLRVAKQAGRPPSGNGRAGPAGYAPVTGPKNYAEGAERFAKETT